MNKPLVTIGVVVYNSARYLRGCFDSLMAQTYAQVEILVANNAPRSGDTQWVRERYGKRLRVLDFENPGFGAAHNRFIDLAQGKYYACLNPDMVFDVDFISRLVEVMEKDAKIGSATGKLWRGQWQDEARERRLHRNGPEIIDSTGLQIARSHRVWDRGQGEVDSGQYAGSEEIFGCSGAAVMFRKEALEDVKVQTNHGEIQQEYFDEGMFLYKEDVDLAYRLRLRGWEAWYVPGAVAWHDRSVGEMAWGSKSAEVRYWSYLHHLRFVVKHWRWMSLSTRWAVWWYELGKFWFVLARSPGVWWRAWRSLVKQNPEIAAKANQMMPKARMDGWFRAVEKEICYSRDHS